MFFLSWKNKQELMLSRSHIHKMIFLSLIWLSYKVGMENSKWPSWLYLYLVKYFRPQKEVKRLSPKSVWPLWSHQITDARIWATILAFYLTTLMWIINHAKCFAVARLGTLYECILSQLSLRWNQQSQNIFWFQSFAEDKRIMKFNISEFKQWL